MIYYINRYDTNKKSDIKNRSGYEHLVSYSKRFGRVKTISLLNRITSYILKSKKPENYLSITFSKEIIVLFKALITGKPVFYLYADKDAFLLPLIKRKFKLSRIVLYGTLHWPVEISNSFSFYKYNLESEFKGIISLSSTLKTYDSKKRCVLPHGVDLNFWERKLICNYENKYLIIGISNRNHHQQIEIIKKIKKIDKNSKFVLLARNKIIQEYYKNIKDLEILKKPITDFELKELYSKCKAVILIQNYCFASNVVLESIAMKIPLIANKIGDIEEYLGCNYPLFIDLTKEDENLFKICTSEDYREKVVNYLESIRGDFDWKPIVKRTIEFIDKV